MMRATAQGGPHDAADEEHDRDLDRPERMVHRHRLHDPVAAPAGAYGVSATSVHFTPGSRTAWHAHPGGQTIYVTEGVGLAQGAETRSR